MTTAYLITNEINLKATMLKRLVIHHFQMISYGCQSQQEYLNSEISFKWHLLNIAMRLNRLMVPSAIVFIICLFWC